MLNKYPLWKYLLLGFIVLFTLVYAAPNLYGEDPAVQVSATRGAKVELSTLDKVQDILKQNNISPKSTVLEDGQILVRLTSSEDQLLASEAISANIGDGFVTALNLAAATPAWLEAIGGGPLKLGLDLRGGVHFLMEVDMDEAISKEQDQLVQDLRSELREQKIRYRGIEKASTQTGVIVRFTSQDILDDAVDYLKPLNPGYSFAEKETGGTFYLTVSMTDEKLKSAKNDALEQNLSILRNRVNELGVAEPLVQRQGEDRIVVELPGIQDTARAKEILGATATLEFHAVDSDTDVSDALAGRIPASSALYKERDGLPVVVKKKIILTGNHIVDAQSGADEYGRAQVNISLDSQGGSKMSRFTKDNIGKPMATLFIEYLPTGKKKANGKAETEKRIEVANVATIQAQLGRSFRITGLDNTAEAHNLALLLRAGALTAPIQIVEERTIGPSLGQQNIDNGVKAMIYGLLAVVLFMLIYYRKFGVVANAALILNLVMIVGFMSLIPGATLTLPGIAGIVLTIGMAVDANVLIFERIREELKAGKSVQRSINEGYSNALSTIADANITTFITAVILFAVGTGPVKGFAVTLAIGILTSMFTSIFGTRAIVNAVWGGRNDIKKLSI
ncbi:protein translocase subunit SecD [Psychromonas sp. 14N.309.X.WAT.B.A12]|uniref:protein translocase subunit SecD n=1 Tax=unclassified Psychromonas TaxID=2614957 RepID=UPI0025B0B647|nr:protein translocase subunit SecD [Psychromonas sp. 14N.309.X.WAT.B.A12]MDN2663130.1 protein translocase subunit SecD [Psychromonas sp. 14N.309.X.WAT.B.A12]